jgi:hypothetical protein
MKTMIPCRVAGCSHAPFDTKQGEVMHYNRVHSGVVRVRGQSPDLYPVIRKGITKRGRGKSSALELPHKKRKYTRRKKAVETQIKPGNTASVEINFCPRCVMPLHPVAVGMVLAKADSSVNGCPRCGLDLRTIAFGIAQHIHHHG